MSYTSENRGYVTSSKVGDFRECEYLYKLKYIDEKVIEDESDAMLFGSAFDLMVTDIEQFKKQYRFVGTRTKKAKELADMNGYTLITDTQQAQLYSAYDELINAPLYTKKNDYIAQYPVETEMEGIPVRGKIDFFSEKHERIIDTKTTGTIQSLEKDLDKLNRYVTQLAFYAYMIDLTKGIQCDGVLEVVSREEPSRSLFLYATREQLRQRRGYINEIVNRIGRSQRSGYYAPIGIVDRTPCLTCPAYKLCEFSAQKDFKQLP